MMAVTSFARSSLFGAIGVCFGVPGEVVGMMMTRLKVCGDSLSLSLSIFPLYEAHSIQFCPLLLFPFFLVLLLLRFFYSFLLVLLSFLERYSI